MRLIAAAASLYVIAGGVAIGATVIVADNGAWTPVLVFAGASAAVTAITALLLAPRLRHLHAATLAARAIAAGQYDARVAIHADEFAALESALNAAGERAARTLFALQLERAQLEALLNASSDATVAVDRGASVVYMNDAARELFAQPGAGPGRQFIEVVRDHDLNELMLAAASHGERSVRVVAYGPAQRWLQATAVPIEGAGAWAALAIFHDLTEVRRLDSVRRDFISNVSHELRTPLAGIRAAAETLQEGALDDKPAAEQFLGHIQRETDRMTQMIEELLELSRIESGAAPLRFASLDAGELVRETARRFAQQADRARLTLRADAPASPLDVIGDAERLERALGNLVANAIKFTPQGGSVSLSAERDGQGVVISVEDTGIGIEAEQQARVFERFFKADPGRGSGGTGLGLAIFKHIVQAHGGTVAVESRAGAGSRFSMRLPRR